MRPGGQLYAAVIVVVITFRKHITPRGFIFQPTLITPPHLDIYHRKNHFKFEFNSCCRSVATFWLNTNLSAPDCACPSFPINLRIPVESLSV